MASSSRSAAARSIRPFILASLGSGRRLASALALNDAAIADSLRELLRAGAADGILKVGDVTSAADAILGAVLLAVLGWARRDDRPEVQAFASGLAGQLIDGLRLDP